MVRVLLLYFTLRLDSSGFNVGFIAQNSFFTLVTLYEALDASVSSSLVA